MPEIMATRQEPEARPAVRLCVKLNYANRFVGALADTVAASRQMRRIRELARRAVAPAPKH
jgi:hypothetical protein